MPEGPELHLASLYVNRMCEGLVFSGAVQKSEVNKNQEVPFCCDAYRVSAVSRGKEVRLTLTPIKTDEETDNKRAARGAKNLVQNNQEPMDIVFRFGMSGFFRLGPESELHKHAHLRFYTREEPRRVLSFVDVRRFGSWEPNGTWQADRGPCIMFEYQSFRNNVLSHLEDKAFDRPICEVLLNQKYFNGIGNYLRAEILYRLNIPPFVEARSVLEGLRSQSEEDDEDKKELNSKPARKTERDISPPDLLTLCNTVPLEVVKMGGKGYDPQKEDYSEFKAWLQCYYVDGMKSIRDHNKRTMWFKGDPGPMAPKDPKTPKVKAKATKRVKKEDHDYTDTDKAAKKKRTKSSSTKESKVKAESSTKAVKVERRVPRRASASKPSRSIQKEEEAEDHHAKENAKPKGRRKSSTSARRTSSVVVKRGRGSQNGREEAKTPQSDKTRTRRRNSSTTAEPQRRSGRASRGSVRQSN
ncbi:endonuclease 8-like 1 isoform X2 [Engraulis encrasicolus]|uniref:endonuclease 8-like 1 isoform X2 n=1 Tax=Engraulis encrasicolus TaxID=184585 RepID=UPI002FD3D2B8